MGVAVTTLSTSEVAEAVISETMLEIALSISEATGDSSVVMGVGSATTRLSTSDAMSPRNEGGTDAPVGRVALMPTSKVTFRPVGAAMSEMQVDATTGIVSTVYVVMITSLVMVENSVGLGQASSVIGAVGTRGVVELPVGNGGTVVVLEEIVTGREKDPPRSPVDVVPLNPDAVEFNDTGGRVTEAGGAVVELTTGVSTMIVPTVMVEELTEEKIVERLPVENDGTVE